MLLLITGASGVGKSSVRTVIAPALAEEGVESVELAHVVEIPTWPTLAWRQEATEAVVARAVALEAEGRHLLLSGDPVAPGEVAAAPSFPRLRDGMRACLLDARPEVQESRLRERGDPPELLPAHHGFAGWMRGHAADPSYMLQVLQNDGWDAMRWDQLPPAWDVAIVDTSDLPVDAVAAAVLTWARAALGGS